MRVKLIKFSTGNYGIRKGCFFGNKEYLDFCTGVWWEKDSKWFRDCQTDEETARRMYGQMVIKDKVVK